MDNSTKAGTIGGTMLTVMANISSGDALRTAVLAGIGAVVSFFISLGLKYLVRWLQK